MEVLRLFNVALAQILPQSKHNFNQMEKQKTLSDIPTDTFNRIIKELLSQGWKKIDEYKGFDAWIDYGMVLLRKKNIKLKFEWDNWTEGEIYGPVNSSSKCNFTEVGQLQ